MHLGKAFRRRMVRVPFDLDDPWWVEDAHFDIEYHLRHTALPAPGDWAPALQPGGPAALPAAGPVPAAVGGVSDRRVSTAIPGVPEGSIGILVRVHHTAIDGVGGIELHERPLPARARTTRRPTWPTRGARTGCLTPGSCWAGRRCPTPPSRSAWCGASPGSSPRRCGYRAAAQQGNPASLPDRADHPLQRPGVTPPGVRRASLSSCPTSRRSRLTVAGRHRQRRGAHDLRRRPAKLSRPSSASFPRRRWPRRCRCRCGPKGRRARRATGSPSSSATCTPTSPTRGPG